MTRRLLDVAPEGFVPTRSSHYFEGLGVEVIEVNREGYILPEPYVPEWADRIMTEFRKVQWIGPERDDTIRQIAALDDEARNAAMTVLDLGGAVALVEMLPDVSKEGEKLGLRPWVTIS